MEEKNNQNSPPESEKYLREIRDAVVEIHDVLQKMQTAKDGESKPINGGLHQHRMWEDVLLSKEVLLEQLRISQMTLAKWRYKGCIKYKNRGLRLIVYSYIDVMDALAEDRLIARGFNPFAAYKRMLLWYRANVENPNQQ